MREFRVTKMYHILTKNMSTVGIYTLFKEHQKHIFKKLKITNADTKSV